VGDLGLRDAFKLRDDEKSCRALDWKLRIKFPEASQFKCIVSRRIEGKDVAAWLFPEFGEPNRYGKRSPNAIARFHRYRVEEGVDDRVPGQRRSRVNFHSWRRWFITEALRARQAERVVKQVVGHKLPKSDVTLGVYFGGDLEATLRECVEAVRLPQE
jgi:integrase